ncbi:MAG: cyclic 2,3-diphosphoglycerate synthase [Syntrophomonas sp.]|uniref:cyclic 2,3-diphosphoglycerate synthase n=1 Tax=Syntrophomonas sp. TaxID=2053627 RepID=UPI0026239388|nr:cyclic 2,3-diphosphoglycerate synthase [Syntrophomonas sp.]MDD2511157.1 cyclic 2,3-diphosphoglycerate synthase [Syntrophomonas sp.]MDD4627421.1 cyclic 2,3-diphosphoglycerate synthase [Syntrophomonas sp.]
MKAIRVIIMGAAGRDFHNFNSYFRDNPAYEVVAFTATQIPDIEGRQYPPGLAGKQYPQGIPIYAEAELPELIKKYDVDQVIFAYSDVSHEYVMHQASLVMAAGADFRLMGPKTTMLKSKRKVVAVTAVRTGSGKSQTTRYVAELITATGKKVAIIRHPMPYGNLEEQLCMRFASYEDLDKFKCTIEEREEFEPHIDNGMVVYAGVDYEVILRQAEEEADVILWDGGNNDIPFYASDLHIVVVDPHRPGHETSYHPGETNLRMADIAIINKIDSADPARVEAVKEAIIKNNPQAKIIMANSPITVENPESVKGKKVLVVEDGPTLTHGEMAYGAGVIAAEKLGAGELIDPRPYAVGSIKGTFAKYGHLSRLLPAMGYGKTQIEELEQTINNSPAEVVVIGTPIDLRRVMSIDKPAVRVRYDLEEIGHRQLAELLAKLL